MVRLKQRYILFDILYFPTLENHEEREKVLKFGLSEKNALLGLHQVSSQRVNPKTLVILLRTVIQEYYGDYGIGEAGVQLSIKYFSNKTSTGIIRCARSSFRIVRAAISLISSIDGREVMMRCLHVSGTIKKCEEQCININNKLMIKLESDNTRKEYGGLQDYPKNQKLSSGD